MQFLVGLGMFFGAGVKESGNSIFELYKNLSYLTLSGGNNFNYDAVSDFIGKLSFPIKKSTLANRDRKKIEDAEKAKEIIGTTFVDLPDLFQQEILDTLFTDTEHKNRTSLCRTTGSDCINYRNWNTSLKWWILLT